MVKRITTIVQYLCLFFIILNTAFIFILGPERIQAFRIIPSLPTELPAITILLFLTLIFFSLPPHTITQIEFFLYSLIITGFMIKKWPDIRGLFPPASYGRNQIIAYVQYAGQPIKADMLIMAGFLVTIIGTGLALIYRNHLLRQKHFHLTWAIHLLSLIIFFLILILVSLCLTN